MKIIRSNPWGTGIHSPYVYDLVSGVIYGKEDLLSAGNIPKTGMKKEDLKQAGMIARLIRFFRPFKVVLIGGNEQFRNCISEYCAAGGFVFYTDHDAVDIEFRNDFVICDSAAGILPCLPDDPENSILVLRDIVNPEMRILMDKLRKIEKVSVTLEVNHSGIVIFNKKLQKENYSIRRCFFY